MPERGDFSKDKSERWLLQQQAGSILRLAGITGFTSWTVEESSLIAPRRLPDGMVSVVFPDRPKPVPFLIEIESYANRDADRQMYENLMLARLELDVIPEGICLVLQPKGRLRVEGRFENASVLGSSQITSAWQVVNLWELRAEDLLAHGDVGLIPWVPLAQIDGPAEPILQQCREWIEREAPASQREAFLVVTAILGQMIHPMELLERIFTGGKPMIDLPIFTTLEAQATQKSLLKQLRMRYGPVSPEIEQELRNVYNPDSLDRLLQSVLTAPDLAAFRTNLQALPK